MAIYGLNGDSVIAVYGVNENEIDHAYDIDGNRIYSNYNPVLTLENNALMSSLGASVPITPQGFAIFGDYYFQFFTGDNKMRIFNKSTYALVGEYSATDIKHANTMQFGAVVQDTGFPLLYVSEWGDSGTSDSKVIDVLKVSFIGYQKITSYMLPSSVGNFPSICFDWEDGKAYTVGYSDGTRDSEYMIISCLGVGDLATPIYQYQVPYMGVLNAWKCYNGKLVFYGNSWDGPTLSVSFINISTHAVEQYSFVKTTNEEYEDCDVDGESLLLSNWVYVNDVLHYRIYSMELPIN